MRVLVADDDASSRLVTRAMLRNLGHECDLVADGDAAWEAFEQQRPDVVLSDWKMPGLDGLELCRRVREQDEAEGSHTYFVLVTAKDRPEDVVSGMRSGADDLLVKPLDAAQLEARLIAASRVAALHDVIAEQQRELVRLNGELNTLARLDALTGLGNRIAMQEHLAGLEARLDRHGHRYSLALLDLDRFDAFNESHGHVAGDQALRSVALALTTALRIGDELYRYGGEEILVVMADETVEGATLGVERLRAAVAALRIPHAAGPAGILTVSAGLAAADESNPRTADAVLAAADAALRRAKEAGRDRLEVDAG